MAKESRIPRNTNRHSRSKPKHKTKPAASTIHQPPRSSSSSSSSSFTSSANPKSVKVLRSQVDKVFVGSTSDPKSPLAQTAVSSSSSKVSRTDMHSLPPKVIGAERGELLLCLDGIAWLTRDPPDNAGLRVMWWGHDPGNDSDVPHSGNNHNYHIPLIPPSRSEVSSSSVPSSRAAATTSLRHALKYPVRSSAEQFAKYLAQMPGGIELQLIGPSLSASSSTKTTTLGMARIHRPQRAVSSTNRTLAGFFPIVTPKGQKLAQVQLSIYYRETLAQNSKDSTTKSTTKPTMSKPTPYSQVQEVSKTIPASAPPPAMAGSPKRPEERPQHPELPSLELFKSPAPKAIKPKSIAPDSIAPKATTCTSVKPLEVSVNSTESSANRNIKFESEIAPVLPKPNLDFLSSVEGGDLLASLLERGARLEQDLTLAATESISLGRDPETGASIANMGSDPGPSQKLSPSALAIHNSALQPDWLVDSGSSISSNPLMTDTDLIEDLFYSRPVVDIEDESNDDDDVACDSYRRNDNDICNSFDGHIRQDRSTSLAPDLVHRSPSAGPEIAAPLDKDEEAVKPSGIQGLSIDKLTSLGRARGIRVTVDRIELNPINIAVAGPDARKGTYAVEYSIPLGKSRSNISHGQQQEKSISETTRMVSRKIEGDRVFIAHRTVYPINIDEATLKQWYDEHIIFKIFYRGPHKKSLEQCGVASFPLRDIIGQHDLKVERDILVEPIGSGVPGPGLKIKPAHSVESICISLELTMSRRGHTSEYIHGDDTLGFDLKDLDHGVDERKEEVVEDASDGDEPIFLVMRLGILRGLEQTNRHGYYAVSKALGSSDTRACSCRSRTVWENNSNKCLDLSHQHLLPVMRNQQFLDGLQNNYAIVELWRIQSGGSEEPQSSQDILLGLIKLPTNDFYLSFRTRPITDAMLRAEYPVVGACEHYPVVHPITGQTFGEIHCFMAMGSRQQIEEAVRQQKLSKTPLYPAISTVGGVSKDAKALICAKTRHQFDIKISKARDLEIFQNTLYGETDCFVQFYFLEARESEDQEVNEDGESYFNPRTRLSPLRTDTKLCMPSLDLEHESRHDIVLPKGLPVQQELLYHMPEGMVFEFWQRHYYPNVRDKLVAKAMLSTARLHAMIALSSETRATQAHSLPLRAFEAHCGDFSRTAGLLDVQIRYTQLKFRDDFMKESKHQDEEQVNKLPEPKFTLIRASGLQSAARSLLPSNAALNFASEIGVNAYVRVGIESEGETHHARQSVTVRSLGIHASKIQHRCFCPVFNSVISLPHSESIVGRENNNVIVAEVWHRYAQDGINGVKDAYGCTRDAPDILLGAVRIPVGSRDRAARSGQGWYPLHPANVTSHLSDEESIIEINYWQTVGAVEVRFDDLETDCNEETQDENNAMIDDATVEVCVDELLLPVSNLVPSLNTGAYYVVYSGKSGQTLKSENKVPETVRALPVCRFGLTSTHRVSDLQKICEQSRGQLEIGIWAKPTTISKSDGQDNSILASDIYCGSAFVDMRPILEGKETTLPRTRYALIQPDAPTVPNANLKVTAHRVESTENKIATDDNTKEATITAKEDNQKGVPFYITIESAANLLSDPLSSYYVSFETSQEGEKFITNNACGISPVWSRRTTAHLPCEDNGELSVRNIDFMLWQLRKEQASVKDNSARETSDLVGIVTVDLEPLSLGLQELNGWYHILGSDGKIKGQLKIQIACIGERWNKKAIPIRISASANVAAKKIAVASHNIGSPSMSAGETRFAEKVHTNYSSSEHKDVYMASLRNNLRELSNLTSKFKNRRVKSTNTHVEDKQINSSEFSSTAEASLVASLSLDQNDSDSDPGSSEQFDISSLSGDDDIINADDHHDTEFFLFDIGSPQQKTTQHISMDGDDVASSVEFDGLSPKISQSNLKSVDNKLLNVTNNISKTSENCELSTSFQYSESSSNDSPPDKNNSGVVPSFYKDSAALSHVSELLGSYFELDPQNSIDSSPAVNRSPENIQTITLSRSFEGEKLGITFGPLFGTPGQYVSMVDPGSMAGKQGSIVRGDQLLSINGTSVQTADHASVVELLEDRNTWQFSIEVCHDSGAFHYTPSSDLRSMDDAKGGRKSAKEQDNVSVDRNTRASDIKAENPAIGKEVHPFSPSIDVQIVQQSCAQSSVKEGESDQIQATEILQNANESVSKHDEDVFDTSKATSKKENLEDKDSITSENPEVHVEPEESMQLTSSSGARLTGEKKLGSSNEVESMPSGLSRPLKMPDNTDDANDTNTPAVGGSFLSENDMENMMKAIRMHGASVSADNPARLRPYPGLPANVSAELNAIYSPKRDPVRLQPSISRSSAKLLDAQELKRVSAIFHGADHIDL